jgi:hypothetical protein
MRPILMMAEIFSRLALMPCLETMNPSSIPLETLEMHFSGLSLMLSARSFFESFFQVRHELVGLFGLDYDVIHVGLNGFPDEVPETLEHTTLVCSPHVFEP